MSRSAYRSWPLFLGIVLGCNGSEEHPGGETLPDGIVAAVGPERVSRALVERIAKAQDLSLPEARAAAVTDALYAAEALKGGQGAATHPRRVALARRLLESLQAEAHAAGPPTDSEVDGITEARWWELNRPEMRRATHAAVLVKDGVADASARALAKRIQEAVALARDPVAFREAASGVDAQGLSVRVEDLSPVTADGRALDPDRPPPQGSAEARYALDFTKALFAISEVGGSSPVVRSEFGYHVILFTERVPELRVPLEERRTLLRDEIRRRRGLEALRPLLERLRKETPVVAERSASELTEKLREVP